MRCNIYHTANIYATKTVGSRVTIGHLAAVDNPPQGIEVERNII